MIGHQLVDSELIHAELTNAGSALVEVLLSLNISCKCGRKQCPLPHCREEKATLKTKSVGKTENLSEEKEGMGEKEKRED